MSTRAIQKSMSDTIVSLRAQLAEREATIARLREALEPFAVAREQHNSGKTPEDPSVEDFLTFEDYCDAARVYAETEPGKEPKP